jgi:hypothetical protein
MCAENISEGIDWPKLNNNRDEYETPPICYRTGAHVLSTPPISKSTQIF